MLYKKHMIFVARPFLETCSKGFRKELQYFWDELHSKLSLWDILENEIEPINNYISDSRWRTLNVLTQNIQHFQVFIFDFEVGERFDDLDS